jgi:hypothetical protein
MVERIEPVVKFGFEFRYHSVVFLRDVVLFGWVLGDVVEFMRAIGAADEFVPKLLVSS